MSKVIEVTEDELQSRRDAVLAEISPTTYEDLVKGADAGTLSEPEWDAWDELQSIEFLLGE